MAIMTIRTTVAFDPATVARWERLARKWGVSKSEALRRAIESAETPPALRTSAWAHTGEEIAAMSPREALECLCATPLITPEQGAAWRAEIQETREDFARRA